MTDAIRAVYRLLRPLGLYRLTGDTLIDAELRAWDAGFTLVEQKLAELRRESFLQTAESYGLALREEAMSIPPKPSPTLEKRRQLLISRLAVSPDDCTLAGMIRSVRAAGLNASILEDPQQERIRIVEDGLIAYFEDIDAVKEDVRRMLPAHLEADFEIGNFTWDDFDRLDVSFNQCDDKNAPWGRLDIDGSGIFEGGIG